MSRVDQLNQNTQPTVTFPVFNNWDVVAEGWYYVCPGDELPKGRAKSFEICGHRLAIFRGADGGIRALDAYCPHMGTDLGIGKVIENDLRCFFHHWKFSGTGQCVDIPQMKSGDMGIPKKACVKSYSVSEKFGAIWVFPSTLAPKSLVDFSDLENEESKKK